MVAMVTFVQAFYRARPWQRAYRKLIFNHRTAGAVKLQRALAVHAARLKLLQLEKLRNPVTCRFVPMDDPMAPWRMSMSVMPLNEEGCLVGNLEGLELIGEDRWKAHAQRAGADILRAARGFRGRQRFRRLLEAEMRRSGAARHALDAIFQGVHDHIDRKVFEKHRVRIIAGYSVDHLLDQVGDVLSLRGRAATRVQSLVRGVRCRARKELVEKYKEKLLHAVPQIRKVQAVARCITSANYLVDLRRRVVLEGKAIAIQKHWRAWIARRHFEILREETVWPLKAWFDFTATGPDSVHCLCRFVPNPSFDDYLYFLDFGDVTDLGASIEQMQKEVAIYVDTKNAEGGSASDQAPRLGGASLQEMSVLRPVDGCPVGDSGKPSRQRQTEAMYRPRSVSLTDSREGPRIPVDTGQATVPRDDRAEPSLAAQKEEVPVAVRKVRKVRSPVAAQHAEAPLAAQKATLMTAADSGDAPTGSSGSGEGQGDEGHGDENPDAGGHAGDEGGSSPGDSGQGGAPSGDPPDDPDRPGSGTPPVDEAPAKENEESKEEETREDDTKEDAAKEDEPGAQAVDDVGSPSNAEVSAVEAPPSADVDVEKQPDATTIVESAREESCDAKVVEDVSSAAPDAEPQVEPSDAAESEVPQQEGPVPNESVEVEEAAPSTIVEQLESAIESEVSPPVVEDAKMEADAEVPIVDDAEHTAIEIADVPAAGETEVDLAETADMAPPPQETEESQAVEDADSKLAEAEANLEPAEANLAADEAPMRAEEEEPAVTDVVAAAESEAAPQEPESVTQVADAAQDGVREDSAPPIAQDQPSGEEKRVEEGGDEEQTAAGDIVVGKAAGCTS